MSLVNILSVHITTVCEHFSRFRNVGCNVSISIETKDEKQMCRIEAKSFIARGLCLQT
jgi:hypothetical protein